MTVNTWASSTFGFFLTPKGLLKSRLRLTFLVIGSLNHAPDHLARKTARG